MTDISLPICLLCPRTWAPSTITFWGSSNHFIEQQAVQPSPMHTSPYIRPPTGLPIYPIHLSIQPPTRPFHLSVIQPYPDEFTYQALFAQAPTHTSTHRCPFTHPSPHPDRLLFPWMLNPASFQPWTHHSSMPSASPPSNSVSRQRY